MKNRYIKSKIMLNVDVPFHTVLMIVLNYSYKMMVHGSPFKIVNDIFYFI